MFSPERSTWTTSRLLRRRVLVGTVAAVAAVGACFLIAVATGADLTVAIGDAAPMAVPFGAAVFATVAAGLGAYLLALLANRTSRPRLTFLVITVAGVLLSAVPPLQAAVQASTAAWLIVMHVVAALTIVPSVAAALSLRRVDRADRTAPGGTGLAEPVGTAGS